MYVCVDVCAQYVHSDHCDLLKPDSDKAIDTQSKTTRSEDYKIEYLF